MLRHAALADLSGIKALLDAAFMPSTFESVLVKNIFQSGEDYYAWVTEQNSRLTSVVVYTQAFREKTPIGYHLAPVAVHPDFQRRGIGSALIQATLNLPPILPAPVFVLGDPKYYERFGFTAIESPICPYDPRSEHFRALRWQEPAEHFTIGYTKSFQVAE